MSSKKGSVRVTDQLPSYQQIIHLIIEDPPPSYEKATGITINNQSVSGTSSTSYQRKIFRICFLWPLRMKSLEGVLWRNCENFGRFTRKHLCWNFFSKVTDCSVENLWKSASIALSRRALGPYQRSTMELFLLTTFAKRLRCRCLIES